MKKRWTPWPELILGLNFGIAGIWALSQDARWGNKANGITDVGPDPLMSAVFGIVAIVFFYYSWQRWMDRHK